VFAPTYSYRATRRGAPLIPIGHYAGLVDIDGNTALALHTDGVGSKVLVAQAMAKFDTVGIDCIAMTVNDLVCLGAEPAAILDYIALERENEPLVMELGKGLVKGAKLASVAIVGGETAILGDVVKGIGGNGFDLVSMGVGFVEKRAVIDGSRMQEGDVIIGVESSGLHSNGYTLARRIFDSTRLRDRPDGLGASIGEALLTPTRIYVRPALSSLRNSVVHGIAHITGGSFAKLARLTGERLLKFEISLPTPPAIFGLLQREGRLSRSQMYSTFNMGIGLCLVAPESELDRISRPFRQEGFRTHHLGKIGKGKGVLVDGLRLT
jgi:phosphoribosylformylglycinamidine cyclo-ligase